MINLLLVIVMVAALVGMVLCNQKNRRRPGLQVIALLLLVLVVVAGGTFVCRLGALSILGFEENNPEQTRRENRFYSAQGYVVGNYIKNRFPKQKVLLISGTGNENYNSSFAGDLRSGGVIDLVEVVLPGDGAAKAADGMVMPDLGGAPAAVAINKAIAAHPECPVVVISGVSPSGDALFRLNAFQMPENERPAIIILGVSNLIEWFSERIAKGYITAMVITDLTKASFELDIPENPVEAFNMRYVLITKDNINSNRRFFR